MQLTKIERNREKKTLKHFPGVAAEGSYARRYIHIQI
jgi:hypothetical protein